MSLVFIDCSCRTVDADYWTVYAVGTPRADEWIMTFSTANSSQGGE